jgi:DNA gyrase subunit B
MRIKKLIKRLSVSTKFCDLTTKTGNFVLANGNIVVHNSHIATLLMIAIAKLVPELIKKGHVYLVEVPLYGAQTGKTFTPLYTDTEVDKFRKTNPNTKIQRYKGLGEMNPEQLKVCALDQSTRHLIKVEYPDNIEDLYILMTDAEKKRELIQS